MNVFPPRSRRWVLAVLGSILTLAFGCRGPSLDAAKGGAALDGLRRVEPRLTGTRTHVPCRSPAADPTDARLPREAICSPNESSPARHPWREWVSSWFRATQQSPEGIHARALLALVSKRSGEDAETAVTILEGLAQENPLDAAVWSDLSAARQVLARRADRPSELIPALAAAEKAVSLDETPAALFNRALALEALFLDEDARDAWRGYLRTDPHSAWAFEAARHLESLEYSDSHQRWERLKTGLDAGNADDLLEAMADYPAATRRHGLEVVLAKWAEARAAGSFEPSLHWLALARRIGEMAQQRQGDRILLESVKAIEAALEAPPSGRLDLLVAGHRAFGEAIRHHASVDLDRAADLYREAIVRLGEADTPFVNRAELGLALTHYHAGRSSQALEALAPVLLSAKRDGQTCLLARATWIAAACRLALARPLEAIETYRAALQLYQAAGEPENVANIQARLADTLEGIGERGQAWRYRYPALKALPALQSAETKSFVLLESAIAALNLGLTPASIPFFDASVRWADSTESPVYRAVSLMHKGNAMVGAGDFKKAAEALRGAWESALEVRASGTRSALQSKIREIEGGLWLSQSKPQAAIDAFTEALDLLRGSDERGYLPELYLRRSMAFEAAGQVDQALAGLRISIGETEREWDRVFARRRSGKDEDLLLSYFSHRRDTFDELIRLLWDRGQVDEALTVAERAQARELLDLVAALPSFPESLDRLQTTARPLAAREIRSRLGDQESLVEFRALEDRLLVWVVSRDRLTTFTVAAPRREIDAQVQTIHRYAAGEGAEEDLRGALERLYSILMAQPLENLPSETELVVIPEGSIGGIPFAALRNPETGRYLIQDHPVSLAPSATLRLYARQRDREIPRRSKPSALLIGDPAFDAAFLPGLRRLSGAAEEVRRVGEYYPESRLLTESKATRAAFLRLAGGSEIVHFAGHAVANPATPSRSYLVLAPEGADQGAMYAHELLALELPRTRLVVLSACGTAGGQPVGALGVSHLVRPFLAAGVPAVVGTLWDVQDDAGKELLSAFHRRFKAGASAAAALRDAQLELLESPNRALRNVLSWAPFQVIGSASLSEEE